MTVHYALLNQLAFFTLPLRPKNTFFALVCDDLPFLFESGLLTSLAYEKKRLYGVKREREGERKREKTSTKVSECSDEYVRQTCIAATS